MLLRLGLTDTKGAHMPSWRCLAGLAAMLAFVLGAETARSQPPQYCRDLAIQFGTEPVQMDGNALAALGGCVMSEIQQRSNGPQPAQPSDYSQPITSPQQGWGQWPQSAPWTDQEGQPQGWGDHLNE